MKSDIFALLQGDTATGQLDAGLPTISLWRAAVHYLMFFTLVPEQFSSHFDDEKRFTFLCPGEECPACAAGFRATEHVYLPVWDVQNRRVMILRFDTRHDGPAREILAFLRTYRDQLASVVAVVDCRGNGQFTITAHRPLPDADRGALACRAFCDGIEAGAIDLRDCVRRMKAEEIAALPAVKRRATRLIGEPVLPGSPATTAELPVGELVDPAHGDGGA